MSTRNAIRCKREHGSVLVVEVSGTLAEEQGVDLIQAVQAEIGDLGRPDAVIFDFRNLSACELLGRARLSELQVWLKSRIRRTAYVTASPRFRGMTLIVIHSSEDENAGSFVSREQADEWIAAREPRAAVHARIVGGAR